MRETVFDIAHHIFYDEVAQKSDADLDFNLSNKVDFPEIKFIPRISVTLPLPVEFTGKYFFEGNVFDNYDDYHNTIWCLFLASVYHTGAHAKVSEYTKYEYWLQDKTPDKGWKVIDYVEDVKVEEYLKKFYPEAWENITVINTTYDELYRTKTLKNSKKLAKEKFAEHFSVNASKEMSELKEGLTHTDNQEIRELTPYLDFLYKNQHILPDNVMPYYEHHYFGKYNKFGKNVKIQPKGEFKRFVENIDELWVKEKHNSDKMMKQYEKLAHNLHFDEIKISPENFGEFLRVRNVSSKLVKKLRSELKMISNVVNSPTSQDIGLIEMQKAIQAEASQDNNIQIFEQDEHSRQNENWVIIFDTSASMKLKFEDMKTLSLCLSEAANELNANRGTWGMYSFNNNFLVVKDHTENYNQQVKSRIGGIENKGLSLIPDAITMGTRILAADHNTEKKYLIIITDGQSLGYADIDEKFQASIEVARKAGISIIGIGVPEGITKFFSATISTKDLRKTVSSFIESYTMLAQGQM